MAVAAISPGSASGIVAAAIAVVLMLCLVAWLLWRILHNISVLHGDAAIKLTAAVAAVAAAQRELAIAQQALAITVEQLRQAHETMAIVVEQLRLARETLNVSVLTGRIDTLEIKLSGLNAKFDGMSEAMRSILETIR